MEKDLVLIIGLCGESVFLQTDHFHQDGETITIDSMYKEPGGKGYNQAIATKLMETNVAFIGAIGNDDYGKICEDTLKKLGIEAYLIKKEEGTAFATILTDKKGNNQVSVYPGASSLLTKDDIDNYIYLFERANFLLLTYELEEAVLTHIYELAEKYQIKIILNPAPYKNYNQNFLHKAFLITPNLIEAKEMLNTDVSSYFELGEKLKKSNFKNTIVTLGKDGVLLVNEDSNVVIPTIKEKTNVVDTTGAGDTLNGCLVAMLNKGKDLIEAIAYSIFAASLSTEIKYVLPSIPSIKDISNLRVSLDKYNEYKGYLNTRKTVRAFLVNENKQYGMLKIEGKDEFGQRCHLETTGGGIENGELEIETLNREILEETGYNGKIISHLGYLVHEYNLIKRISIASYYLVLVNTKNQDNTKYTNEESSLIKGIKWMNYDELKTNLNQNKYPCDYLVQMRELEALKLLDSYLQEENND